MSNFDKAVLKVIAKYNSLPEKTKRQRKIKAELKAAYVNPRLVDNVKDL